MTTKKVTRDAASATDLADKFEAQVPAAKAAFEALAARLGVPLKGKLEDVAADVIAVLRASARSALGLDQTHGVQATAHGPSADVRDQATSELHDVLDRLRSGLEGQYGKAQVSPVFGKIPVVPGALSTYTAQLIQALGKVAWTPLAKPMGSVDLAQSIALLTADLAALDAALAAVGKANASATGTIANRDHGEEQLHHVLIGAHSVADGLLTLVGMAVEAARLALVHHSNPAPAPVVPAVTPPKS